MRLALDVEGEPAACLAAAEDLHRLGDAVGAAADALAGQVRVGREDFGGFSGDAFRAHARRLVEPTDDLAHRCHRLADALHELARDLRDVRRAMALARQQARPRLVVTAHGIEAPAGPGGAADRDAWRAWDEAVRTVDAARQLEARAQADWRAALERFALGSEGLSPYHPLLGPHLPPMPPPDGRDPLPPRGPADVDEAPGPGPGATVSPASPAGPSSPAAPGAPEETAAPTPAPVPAATHGVAAGHVGTTYAAGAVGAAPVAAAGSVTGTDGAPADPPTCPGIPPVTPAPLEGTWCAGEVDPQEEGERAPVVESPTWGK
jgi:hypothetical protein